MAIEKNIDPKIIKAEETAEKTSTSKGEKLFDWLTYGGIAFAGVFIATLPWTYCMKYGAGKKFHTWVTGLVKKHGGSEPLAENVFSTLVLGSLGNAAVVPVKIMENNKPQLVEKFNHMLGDTSADASVDEDPKQTWTSLIISRVAAYTACFVSLTGAVAIFGGEKFKKFEEKFAENVVCKPLGYATHIEEIKNGQKILQETKAFRYGKIGALDVFATAAAASLLYLGSRFFAKRNDHWHAEHTHINNEGKASKRELPEPALNTALPAPADKLYANSITPRSNETTYKIRTEKFADSIADKKSIASEIPIGMGA